jgi:hypothetical protein
MEGQLYKYTNVMRGFQMRYFVVNQETTKLDYYMVAETRKKLKIRTELIVAILLRPKTLNHKDFAARLIYK